jgi:hypothetical protein
MCGFRGAGQLFKVKSVYIALALVVTAVGGVSRGHAQKRQDAIVIRARDINVLMADRANRPPSLQDYVVWGAPIGRAWVKNWKQPGQVFRWTVFAQRSGKYQASILAKSSGGAQAEVDSDFSSLRFSLSTHWNKVTLTDPLKLPKGQSIITIHLLHPDNADLKSLELINLRSLGAIQHRVKSLRSSTQWLSDAKYGLMFQWGGWGYPQHGPAAPWCQMIKDFNVEPFASTVQETGAGYVIWSATWEKYLFSAPIKAIDAIAPGHTCSRDLIADLATALNKRGIKLMLYYHAGHGTDFWSKT